MLKNKFLKLIQMERIISSHEQHFVNGSVEHWFQNKSVCAQVRSFFGSLTEETGSEMRCIRQTYETIEDNIRWMDTNLPLLQAWLDKRSRRNVHEDL